MTALNELLKLTACAAELATQPRSWEQLMTAVAAGAIDYDQVADVTQACVELANRAIPGQSWDDAVINALFASDGDESSQRSQTLIACGRAADEFVRNAN